MGTELWLSRVRQCTAEMRSFMSDYGRPSKSNVHAMLYQSSPDHNAILYIYMRSVARLGVFPLGVLYTCSFTSRASALPPTVPYR